MGYRNINQPFQIDETALNAFSDHFDLDSQALWSCQIKTTSSTFAAVDFLDAAVSVADDEITVTGHGLIDGLLVRLTTTGTLPTGLSTGTDYYVIVVDANTIKLADARSKVSSGDAVNITAAAGGGTHSIAYVATLDLTVTAQATNNDGGNQVNVEPTDWVDLTDPAALSISASGVTTFYFSSTNLIPYRFLRFKFAVVSGAASAIGYFHSKG